MIIQVSVVLRRTVSGSLLEWILQNKAGHPMVFTQCSIRNRIDKYRELQRRSDLGGGGGGACPYENLQADRPDSNHKVIFAA